MIVELREYYLGGSLLLGPWYDLILGSLRGPGTFAVLQVEGLCHRTLESTFPGLVVLHLLAIRVLLGGPPGMAHRFKNSGKRKLWTSFSGS